MLDEKVEKGPDVLVEHKKSQEQYQKMLREKAGQRSQDENLLEGKKDLSILPVIHLV
jgi:uncharacterized protein YgiM (DUF1202 family)